MAVEETTKTTEGTGLSEEVDTSTNGDTLDTDGEDLEDSSLSFEDFDDETEEPEEFEEEEAATDPEPETEEEPVEDVQDEEPVEDDTPSEEDKRIAAQEAYRQREAQRIQREEAKAQQQKEYLEAAENNQDLAVRQLQIDAYNNKVTANFNTLENGIEKAVATIDLFQSGSPEIKQELAASLDDFERMYVQRDSNGDPVSVNGDVYQYLQQKADSIRRLTGVGARNEVKAKNNAKTRTDTIPSRTPKEPKKDDMLDGFDEEASRYQSP